MRIARDGKWFYYGTPINRPALVQPFFDDFAQGAKATEAKIIAEIAKNLANHTIAEIKRLLMTERYQR